MPKLKRNGSNYISNLQVLRLIAAMLVVVGHLEHEVINGSAKTGVQVSPLQLFDWGLGVDIFFVISGFIMFYLMHDSFAIPGAARAFLWRRVVRIVPLYWTCTTLTLLSVLLASSLVAHNDLDWRHILASYLFVPWPRSDGSVFPLLSLGWTLNYEMFFYLVFSLVLLLPIRIGISALALFFVALMAAAGVSHEQFWALTFYGDTIIGEFVLGIGLAWLYLSDQRLSRLQGLLLVVAGVALAIGMYEAGLYLWIGRVVTGGLPALLIASGVVLPQFGSQSKILRWAALGGDASYVLYLTHPFVARGLTAVWQKLSLPYSWLFVVVGVIIAGLVSVAIHVFIEKPLTSWILSLTTVGRFPSSGAAEPSR